MCDGDDYWTDPHKLQKQIDFLETNLVYAGCFHETQQLLDNNTIGKVYGRDVGLVLNVKDTLSTESPFHTSSFVFRNTSKDLPEWFSDVISGDMALFSIISAHGPLRKIPQIMSVYRKHTEGLTNSLDVRNDFHRNRIKLMHYLDDFHKRKFHSKIRKVIREHERLDVQQRKSDVRKLTENSRPNIDQKCNQRENKRTVLAIVCPQIGTPSETFIRKHIENVAPGRTVILTGNILSREWFKGPIRTIPISIGRYTFDRKIQNGVIQFLKKNKVTHILIEFGCIGGAVIELNNKILHLPIYVHFHGQDASEYMRLPEIREYYRWVGTMVDGVIAVSRPMAERLCDIGIPREKIKIIHYGVDPDDEHVSLSEGTPCRFLSVSRLVGKKGVFYVLQAFEKTKHVFPDVTLDLIGDGPLRPEIEKFIDAHNLKESVHLHGERPHEYVLQYMNRSSVFVQHSITDPLTGNAEGLPLSILEASAHALPVVSTFHEGIPEAIENERTGFLVKEGDWELMAEFMIRLASETKLRQEMGAAGRKKILSDGFTVEAMTEKLRDVIGLVSSNNTIDSISSEPLKRILLVNHSIYPLENSGTPVSTRNHAVGMKSQGFDVAVLIPSMDVLKGYRKRQMKDGFALYEVPAMNKFEAYMCVPNPLRSLQYEEIIGEIFEDFHPQMVHINDYVYLPAEIVEIFSRKECIIVREICNFEEFCHQDYPVLSSGLNGRLCTGPESPNKCASCLLELPISSQNNNVSGQSLELLESRIDHRFQYVRMLYRDIVDVTLFTSERFQEYFTRFVPIDRRGIRVVPRGFELDYSPQQKNRNANGEPVQFAFVGNLMFSKGCDVVLGAFEKTCDEHDFVLRIFGSLVNPEYRVWINALKDRYPGKIEYYGGFSADEIFKISSKIDVCIVPSYFDTYNRVTREMLHLGIPVIATDFFGAFIVEDGKNGFRIPVGDVDALAEKMIYLIEHHGLLSQLSDGAARTHIPSLGEEIDQLLCVYKDAYHKGVAPKRSPVYTNDHDGLPKAGIDTIEQDQTIFYQMKIQNLEDRLNDF